MPLPGTLIAEHYRIVRSFARGASSVVYLAFDPTGVPYVLKLFPPHLQARAQREYSLSHAWTHPNINPVEKMVTLEGQPGVLSRFVIGEVLSRAFVPSAEQPALSGALRTTFISALLQLCDALAYLHESGTVHRDLKPENVLVRANGQIALIDFDLSGPIGEQFKEQVSMGTIGYMAPEQIRGIPIYPSSDLYSLGVLIYWGLTGQLPFYGSAQEVLHQHLNAKPIPPQELRGGIFDPLDQVCLQLLSKNPNDRGESARAIAQLIRELAPITGGSESHSVHSDT